MFDWPQRSKIIWFGRPPTDADFREVKNRGLIIEAVAHEWYGDLRHARAAVFWAPEHFEAVLLALHRNAARAVDEGLFLHIVAGNDGQRKALERALAEVLPADTDGTCRVRTLPGVEAHEGPNKALLHDPGPAANQDLDIQGNTDKLTEAHRLLLKRAFHDCNAIDLQLISGGLSGALTFLVDARLSDSNAGRRPAPFFAKLDIPSKLRGEMSRFRRFAEHHVHWCLRPNFVDARSIFGVGLGILVGTFVPESKSLWQAVREPNGSRYIRTLFEETLAGLRQDVPSARQTVEQGSVVAAIEEFCRYSRISGDRVTAAVRWGPVEHPSALWHKLLDLSPQQWRAGVMHGDMHGENVRVRKEDAIVIDFAHAAPGPLAADLANLEVWLAVTVPPEDAPDREAWRQDVEHLFRPDAIDSSFANRPVTLTSVWLKECIEEIRKLAVNSTFSADEYKRVLAVYLLRHSSFETSQENPLDDEFRRTYAYWLANRLVLALTAKESVVLETI